MHPVRPGIRKTRAAQRSGARGVVQGPDPRLAELASVSVETIKRLGGSLGPVPAYASTIVAIRRALENAGVQFLDENGGGGGVRLKKRMPKKR
jgi:hypothetical protein